MTKEERDREKTERLAAALRANLRRRKQPPPVEPEAEDQPDGDAGFGKLP